MEFEWDPRKADENLKKHKVSFEEAQEAFVDPNGVDVFDDTHSDVEIRFILLAFSSKRLLFVGYTTRDEDVIRIVTARKATAYEREFYYEGE